MKPIDDKENLEDKNNPPQQINEKFVKNANKVDYFPANRSEKQTKSEIAEQGFTVRDGHNPNKPNPYEKQVINDVSELNIEFQKGIGLNVEKLDDPSGQPVEQFQDNEEDIEEDETDDQYDDIKRGDKQPNNNPLK